MDKYERIVHLIAITTFYVTMVGLAVITGLTFMDVCLRYMFNKPIYGVYDITRVVLIVTIACAFGQTQITRGHIAIDFLVLKLGQRPKAVVNGIHDVISLGLFLLIAWQAFKHGNSLKMSGEATETVLIPFYPFVYVISFNAGIVCLTLLAQLSKSVGELVRK